MARLRDIPHVRRTVGIWTFGKRVYNQAFFEDNLLVWAAALAFSWLLALFPFLIFALSLVPFLPDRVKPSEQTILETIEEVLVTGEPIAEASKEALEEAISPEAEVLDPERNEPDGVPTTVPADLGMEDEPPTSQPATAESDASDDLPDMTAAGEEEEPDAAEEGEEARQPAIISQTVTALVSNLINEKPGGAKVALSIVIALFTASSGVLMTMAGLDKCYDVAPEKIRPFYKSRPVAMLLTIVLSVMILLTIIILPIGGTFIAAVADGKIPGINVDLGWVDILSRPLRWTVGLLLLFSAVGLVYKFGPSVKTRLHIFSPGSIFTIFMWIATAFAFQLYLGTFNAADSYARTYGAVAGVAILMFLFYIDALFLLIGAEINAEIDFIRLGIKSGPLPDEREVAADPAVRT